MFVFLYEINSILYFLQYIRRKYNQSKTNILFLHQYFHQLGIFRTFLLICKMWPSKVSLGMCFVLLTLYHVLMRYCTICLDTNFALMAVLSFPVMLVILSVKGMICVVTQFKKFYPIVQKHFVNHLERL